MKPRGLGGRWQNLMDVQEAEAAEEEAEEAAVPPPPRQSGG